MLARTSAGHASLGLHLYWLYSIYLNVYFLFPTTDLTGKPGRNKIHSMPLPLHTVAADIMWCANIAVQFWMQFKPSFPTFLYFSRDAAKFPTPFPCPRWRRGISSSYSI